MRFGCLRTWLGFRSRWFRRLCYTSLGVAIFTYGLGVGHYRWPPFWLIYGAKTAISQALPQPIEEAEYLGEQELLQYAFTDPVAETDLYYPPITSLEGIREANQRIFMLQEGFETAYQDLEVIDAQQIEQNEPSQPVVKVQFRYQGRDYQAFAYGRLPAACDGQGTASLIIPGSGLNQSLSIATGDPGNYHYGALHALDNTGGDIYTYIKPNEDLLAWHDGNGKKLNLNFIVNYHLNLAGSYTVSYLVEAMAVTKYISTCYDKIIIAGLSSGGTAAMVVSLQSSPNIAISRLT